jgi:hypothetical protein
MEPAAALPKARQPTIDKWSKDDLLKFFQKATFKNTWTAAERNAYVAALVLWPEFDHLNKGQILRVYKLLTKSKDFTKGIAKFVLEYTDSLDNDPSRRMSRDTMISIFAELYAYYMLMEEYHGLPLKLFHFLGKCQKWYHSNALGQTVDLNQEEKNYIDSFIRYFTFVLLKSYK